MCNCEFGTRYGCWFMDISTGAPRIDKFAQRDLGFMV